MAHKRTTGEVKIGLALSGGGALGAAHIGVLEEIDRHTLRIERICGTSSGAIIGLLYAAGGTAAIHTFLDDLRSRGVIGRLHTILTKTPDRIFAEITDVLHAHVPVKSFSELAIPFSCVATDLISGEMTVLDDGGPVAAVMASAAYPGVFPIQRLDGHSFIDGGVTRNFPADIVKESGVSFVIGSSLYCLSKLRPGKQARLSRLQAMLRAFEIQERELSIQQMEHCDFCFSPPVHVFRWYEFDQVDAIVDLGRAYARSVSDGLLQALQKHQAPKPSFLRSFLPAGLLEE